MKTGLRNGLTGTPSYPNKSESLSAREQTRQKKPPVETGGVFKEFLNQFSTCGVAPC